MKTDITFDITHDSLDAAVKPATNYNKPYLLLRSGGSEIGIEATDEQLEEIAFAIDLYRTQLFLARNRSHEVPDQQRILNHEVEGAAVHVI